LAVKTRFNGLGCCWFNSQRFSRQVYQSRNCELARFIECGSWAKAREMGKLKVEGKDYIVNDGDIVYYKI